VDKNKLKELEKLSLIEIGEGNVDRILELVNADIACIKRLDRIDTDGQKPMVNPCEITLEAKADRVADGNLWKELGACSPDIKFGCFVVPRTVTED
jgi:aspartyl/glutamyl-tRNA(Asn/Gln) amidotransferase C subunit